jgi:hypothetical protein
VQGTPDSETEAGGVSAREAPDETDSAAVEPTSAHGRQKIDGQLMDTRRQLYAPGFRELAVSRGFAKVSEGTRTPDRLDHNQIEWVRLTHLFWDLQGLLALGSSQFCSR